MTHDWWTEAWLNEGFASYFEALPFGNVFPDADPVSGGVECVFPQSPYCYLPQLSEPCSTSTCMSLIFVAIRLWNNMSDFQTILLATDNYYQFFTVRHMPVIVEVGQRQ